jgi:TRAP-type mannitol/chloroaromatic compound transport system permease large subunit
VRSRYLVELIFRISVRVHLRRRLLKAFPIFILILLVLGGIYGGVFTPTEAGAFGAFGAMLLAVARRSLSAKVFMADPNRDGPCKEGKWSGSWMPGSLDKS